MTKRGCAWSTGCLVVAFSIAMVWVARSFRTASYWNARQAVYDMEVIGGFVEACRAVHGFYPFGNIDDLEGRVPPHRLLPVRGAWGKYVYIVSGDRRHYRIVCGGRDRQIERRSLTITATAPVVQTTTDWTEDIVFQDGKLIQVHTELEPLLRSTTDQAAARQSLAGAACP
jgi:hypothetical protein